ncbi:hypothetical protein B0H10DRAFT_1960431 [Mycena sp. CBHHK59/15]|nr:hypothetical protein B0H10DRAFT_1960431 [Mycena sp. CBHHK59/15]
MSPWHTLYSRASTVDLAAFLSTVWLNSDYIDMMMEDLTARVKADPDLARLYNNIYHALKLCVQSSSYIPKEADNTARTNPSPNQQLLPRFLIFLSSWRGRLGYKLYFYHIGTLAVPNNRESALLAYAANLDKQAVKRGHLARWANDLQDLADAILDTHGLMIHRIWKGLPPPIRRQISPNHASWETFCNALRNLVPGVETIPDTNWRHPFRSGLVVKLNHHMPELFRGRDPDPSTPKKKKKNRSLSPGPVHDYDYVSDSEDEDIDTAVIPESEPEAEPEVEISVPLSSEMHGDGTDLSQYFWPGYALPVLSNGFYDARKTIMDLGSVFVEFEPLLHTSPQIYTLKQWDGVKQHRGFKIGYAIEFLSHILSWNTFDNNSDSTGVHEMTLWKIMRIPMFPIQFMTIRLGALTA